MKIKDPETIEERIYRENLLHAENIRSIPIIICLIVVGILTAFFVGKGNANEQALNYGLGNPYNCEICKNTGRACSNHRNYDKNKALEDKVTCIVNGYKPDISDGQMAEVMYGVGNTYNTSCDFCVSGKKECYSCEYDRKYIMDQVDTITKSEVFQSRLCDDCWKVKYAKCDKCRGILIDSILESIQVKKK